LVTKSAQESDGVRIREFDFEAQPQVTLELRLVEPAEGSAKRCVLNVVNGESEAAAARERVKNERVALALFAPRGFDATAWSGSDKKQIQIRRRFMLLGQTLDGMRAWDIRRAVQAIRSSTELAKLPLWIEASGDMAVDVLYASLFESGIERLSLSGVPSSHMDGPDFLNV